MITMEKFTSADLETMPDDGSIYEIIEGELYVSRAPGYEHQYTCGRLFRFIDEWNDRLRLGVVFINPGLILAEVDDVIPDVVWISHERFENSTDGAGHLISPPELVIEVLSPGKLNEYRDRQSKLDLYSRCGVQEYWIVDWMRREVNIYRREGEQLVQTSTLTAQDQLEIPLLPGFTCRVEDLFFALPIPKSELKSGLSAED